ncbi:hypothetical protein [Sporomusa termitida]|uniref:Uncharacterized protein n=1 Tax=Sporomusa termitida TaxID=2377 RepID=A0A517DXH0_9FIRM|nr:hypothetical protein [Sporomusa termitida]QDR82050.1 hypothetical protein SPTER_34710 [Sporomusa termitida]
MIQKRIVALVTLVMLIVSGLAVPAAAQAAGELTVIGKLAVAEKNIYGAAQTGSLVDRVTKVEQDLYGQEAYDAVLPRVEQIYTYIFEANEHTPSLLIKLNAVEWTLTQRISDSAIMTRIEKLEETMNGLPGTGSLDARLDALLNLAYTDGNFEVVPAILAKDTLVKIKTLSKLNSKQSRVGDSVALGIAEDVFIGGVLVLPKGAIGTGKITEVRQAKNFGRDAKLEISFDNVRAVDGSSVNTFLGDKAKAETKSMAKAAGASVAGMVILGPVGIIGGAFISGKDAEIPIGSQMYIQTKDDVEVYGIRVK